MKLKLFNYECWIRDDAVLSLDFYFMSDDGKWGYILDKNLIHREDGPVDITSYGTKWWYLNLNDKYINGEIFKKIQSSTKEELLVYMINPEYKDYLPLIEYRLSL